ncbi:hypothetical protein A8D71_33430 [Burkholderia cenocepacia]|nr:hypothetical protein A8D71_33430 [Burkholderia cenocepacia]
MMRRQSVSPDVFRTRSPCMSTTYAYAATDAQSPRRHRSYSCKGSLSGKHPAKQTAVASCGDAARQDVIVRSAAPRRNTRRSGRFAYSSRIAREQPSKCVQGATLRARFSCRTGPYR